MKRILFIIGDSLVARGVGDVDLEGVAVEGVAVEGVAVEGVAVEGVVVEGMAVEGIAVEGVDTEASAAANKLLLFFIFHYKSFCPFIARQALLSEP